MNFGIADTINRRDARLIAEHLDRIDGPYTDRPTIRQPWPVTRLGELLAGEVPASTSARVWTLVTIAAKVEGLTFDCAPADCDWDGFFTYLRAEILARRDPQTPSVCGAESPVRDGVGSQ